MDFDVWLRKTQLIIAHRGKKPDCMNLPELVKEDNQFGDFSHADHH